MTHLGAQAPRFSHGEIQRINAKVMADPRLAAMMDPQAMPLDGKRVFWGGFKATVEL